MCRERRVWLPADATGSRKSINVMTSNGVRYWRWIRGYPGDLTREDAVERSKLFHIAAEPLSPTSPTTRVQGDAKAVNTE